MKITNILKNEYLKAKDYVFRYLPFIREREMFYIEPNSYKIIEPKECYKNMTHREWFKNIGYKNSKFWEFFTRGYYKNGVIKIFSGIDHGFSFIKDIDKTVKVVYDYYNYKGYEIKEIHVGNIHNSLRTLLNLDWKPILIVNLKSLKENNKVELIVVNIEKPILVKIKQTL